MSLAVKQIFQEKDSVSKHEFEKAYVELMDNIRIIDQRLSTKADDVVLTMTLAHRQEIEELQSAVISLRNEMKIIKQQEAKKESYQLRKKVKTNRSYGNWFKKMQLARK